MQIIGRINRFGLAVGMGIGMSGVAIAISSNAFTYSPAKTGSYMIGPADLQPEATDANTVQYSLSPIFFSTGHASGDDNCFMAPVHLPHGAKTTRLITTYESGAEANPFFRLMRVNAVADDWGIMAVRFITDNSATRRNSAVTIPASVATVNNGSFIYNYEICLGYKDVFYGARIEYQYFNAGD